VPCSAIDVVGHEHRIGFQQQGIVEPDFGERRESVQPQRARAFAREGDAVPVIAGLEGRGPFQIEPARRAQRRRDRAGHGRVEPAFGGQIGRRRVRAGLGRKTFPAHAERARPHVRRLHRRLRGALRSRRIGRERRRLDRFHPFA
jgi:hypothetical protein